MSDTYSHWYRNGSCTVQNSLTKITGVNTYWLNANIKPGDMFSLDGSKFYEIDAVVSNTELTLKTPYLGETTSNTAYMVIRNFTATLAAETAAKVTEIVAKHEQYVNSDMQTVQGKSAYEVAIDSGFVGTVDEWLQSLTGYGQAKEKGYTGTYAEWLDMMMNSKSKWEALEGRASSLESRASTLETTTSGHTTTINSHTSTINSHTNSISSYGTRLTTLESRTAILVDSNRQNWQAKAAYHNSIYRGKSLGSTITDAQWNAIKNGTFDDMFLGDYWTLKATGEDFASEDSIKEKYIDPSDYLIDGYQKFVNTKSITFRIVDFGFFYGGMAPWNVVSHVVLMPVEPLYNFQSLKRAAEDGTTYPTTLRYSAYLQSPYKTGDHPILELAVDYITDIFGDHIMEHREEMPGALNTDKSGVSKVFNNKAKIELPDCSWFYGYYPSICIPFIEQSPIHFARKLAAFNFANLINYNNCTFRTPASPEGWLHAEYSGAGFGLSSWGGTWFWGHILPIFAIKG